MLSRLHSAAVVGVDAVAVQVEVDITRGLPGYFVVGLPDESVRESRERVRSAVLNSGAEFPVRRVTVNLAPADLRKEGSSFDLPIALGILASQGAVPPDRLGEYLVAGELSLTGEVRPIRGVLSMAAAAAGRGYAGFVLPRGHAGEARLVRGLRVVGVSSLTEAIAFFRGEEPAGNFEEAKGEAPAPPAAVADFADVRGQASVRRALEVAAAGAHNALMIGPPGSGKTMMAHRLPGILPLMTHGESLETTRIHSVAGLLPPGSGLITARPFRSPHHTVSYAGLVGGGAHPRPGEVSLAHHGVLFLDELPEFSRHCLEAMRQPLEDGSIAISRASGNLRFPARFMLVGAMNPCPCGHATDPYRECACSPGQIRRYLSRVSGPLMDRIDIHVEVPPVGYGDLSGGEEPEGSAAIRARVESARGRQAARHDGDGFLWNGEMDAAAVRRHCALPSEASRMLGDAMRRLGLSARACGKVLRLARTVADLEGSAEVAVHHLAEAVGYRGLDRVR